MQEQGPPKKKKILFHTDFSLSKTGFGRNAKTLLSYLYNTGKYDIVALCGGISKNHPELERTPWKSYGSVPSHGTEKAEYDSSPEKAKLYAYGAYELNNIIDIEKPDFYFGIQDIWGVDYAIEKPWFDKINSVIWTTLDSLPILPTAVSLAPKIKNYWVWSNFAEKEMHKLGHRHVKTLHGAVDPTEFKIFPSEQKSQIRQNNNIQNDNFVIGFVFRNQLRKSVPNLLQGFKLFKDSNRHCNPKLLLHTHWQEGWNILKICNETGVDPKDILTTYVCRACKNYEVKNYSGAEATCKFCNTEKACVTTGTSFGISEKQLNEVYNMMDVYCHPFTSGGQEIPIQEAKLTGLITLVTNYSCGEEMCCPEACSLPLEWTEYREFGTEFIKASTCPKSIARNLETVLKMDGREKAKLGKMARKWVIDNFSTEYIGSTIEKFIDSNPKYDWSLFEKEVVEKNPDAKIPQIEDPVVWVKTLYSSILLTFVKDDDAGLQHWIEKLRTGTSRESIEGYFREVAKKENQKNKSVDPVKFFGDTKPEDRILVSINSSLDNIFLSTKMISAIKEKYPEKKIFVSSNESCINVFLGNTMIESAVVQNRDFNDPQFLKSNFFECYCLDKFSIDNNHAILTK